MSEVDDRSAYMERRTRALEDLVVRERTDDEGDDELLSAASWHMPMPTHWAVDPWRQISASWMRAFEEL